MTLELLSYAAFFMTFALTFGIMCLGLNVQWGQTGVFAGLTVQLRPTLGLDLLLPLFAAVILGGIGSVWGAVLGGLIVGVAESAAVSWVGAEYRAATAFVVLTAILLVRPNGLFGERR